VVQTWGRGASNFGGRGLLQAVAKPQWGLRGQLPP